MIVLERVKIFAGVFVKFYQKEPYWNIIDINSHPSAVIAMPAISLPYNHGASPLSFSRSGFRFPFMLKPAKMGPKLLGRSDNGSLLKTPARNSKVEMRRIIDRRKIDKTH
jgi:hypothetical protein